MLIIYAIVLLYLVLVGLLFVGLLRVFRAPPGDHVPDCKLTLIVPFRDEAVHLPGLVRDLLAQDYPGEKWRAIFVDDHSRDGGRFLLRELLSVSAHMQCIQLEAGREGKKAALAAGMEVAESEWVLQCDADCRVGPQFISLHARAAASGRAEFYAGPVTTAGTLKNLAAAFERLDLLSLQAAGAGSFAYGRPLMCNGANLMYKKSLYDDTRRFDPVERTPSGDDMFLMIGARKLGRKQAYLGDSGALVKTVPQGRWRRLIHQRLRWMSKSPYYAMPDIQSLAVLVVLANVCIGLSPLLSLLYPGCWPEVLLLIGLKFFSDFLLCGSMARRTGQLRSMLFFPLVFLMYYPFYLVVLLGSVRKAPPWKGRRMMYNS